MSKSRFAGMDVKIEKCIHNDEVRVPILTTYTLPPEVRMYYDSLLLKRKILIPHEYLLERMQRCIDLANKKYVNCPKKMRKFLKLCEDVKQEYERKENVKALLRAKKEKEKKARKERPDRNSGSTFILRRYNAL